MEIGILPVAIAIAVICGNGLVVWMDCMSKNGKITPVPPPPRPFFLMLNCFIKKPGEMLVHSVTIVTFVNEK